jgi:hypothetical protein
MAPLPFTSSQSGPRITVDDWLKDPTRLPVYVLSLMKQGFLADAVLRPGGAAPAGVVRFDESTPLYADSSVTNRAEGAEVPVATVSRGVPNVAYTQDKALRLIITEEMRRRNSVDVLQTGMTQVTNTMIRAFDDMFIAAVLNNANILSQAVSGGTAWATGTPRKDILLAAKQIEGALDGQGAELGYVPDTLIVNRATKFDLINSTDFNQVYTYGGNIADEHLQYTGVLPHRILDYDVLFSPRVPSGTAILCQRGVCGAIFDEVPLKAYDLDEDRNRLSWSSIVQRVSAVAIDQPKSVCKITGV